MVFCPQEDIPLSFPDRKDRDIFINFACISEKDSVLRLVIHVNNYEKYLQLLNSELDLIKPYSWHSGSGAFFHYLSLQDPDLEQELRSVFDFLNQLDPVEESDKQSIFQRIISQIPASNLDIGHSNSNQKPCFIKNGSLFFEIRPFLHYDMTYRPHISTPNQYICNFYRKKDGIANRKGIREINIYIRSNGDFDLHIIPGLRALPDLFLKNGIKSCQSQFFRFQFHSHIDNEELPEILQRIINILDQVDPMNVTGKNLILTELSYLFPSIKSDNLLTQYSDLTPNTLALKSTEDIIESKSCEMRPF